MKVDFEGMVTLIHEYQIKGATARVEQKEEELTVASRCLLLLHQDDSEARKLAQDILDMAEKLKAT